jgi:hypothetical protein
VISIFVRVGLNPLFLEYLFLAFILKTLTFSHLNSLRILKLTLEPSIIGVPILVSFPSSSEISNASVLPVFLPSNCTNFFTSITSHFLTMN